MAKINPKKEFEKESFRNKPKRDFERASNEPRKEFKKPSRPEAPASRTEKESFRSKPKREFERSSSEPRKEFKKPSRPETLTSKTEKDSFRNKPKRDFERASNEPRTEFKPRRESHLETPAPKAEKELKYYGLHACLAIWKKRSNDIIRVYLNEGNVKVFKALLKWCADNKKAYHIVPDEELQKVSESVHHEGVCILAKNQPPITADQFMATLTEPKICLLYLDGVQNPHNIGSILRSCAHFGVPYVLGEQGKLPALSPSACRIAKGGSELVRLVSLENPLKTLQALKAKGFTFVSTSSHGGTSLFKSKFGPKTVIIMGSETSGVSEKLFSLASNKVQIPGTGEVESLNVSVATSLCLGEYARQYQ